MPASASCATSDNQRRKTINEIFDEKVNSIIDARNQQTKEALKEIEKTFRTGIESHITYHRILMKSAKERGDLPAVMRCQVMIETYESILKSYSLSRSYD